MINENEERLTQNEYQKLYWLLGKFSGKSLKNKNSYDVMESNANELLDFIEFRAYPLTEGEKIGVREGWFCATGSFVRFEENKGVKLIVLKDVEVRAFGENKNFTGEQKYSLHEISYYRTFNNDFLKQVKGQIQNEII